MTRLARAGQAVRGDAALLDRALHAQNTGATADGEHRSPHQHQKILVEGSEIEPVGTRRTSRSHYDNT